MWDLDLVGGVARGGRECCARRASSPFAGGVAPPPLRVVTRVKIPVVMNVVSCRLLEGLPSPRPPPPSVWSPVRSSLRSSVWSSMWSSLLSSVWSV